MTSVGVDFGAVATGAQQLGAASDAFGQRAGQVGGVPGAAAPDQRASALLERVLEAIMHALGNAASELEGLSAGLAATANSYEHAEQVLASWHVPGGAA